MGAGLERFAWITMGTPTAYDCCFGEIRNFLIEKAGIDADSSLLKKYYIQIAKNENKFPDILQARSRALIESKITERPEQLRWRVG